MRSSSVLGHTGVAQSPLFGALYPVLVRGLRFTALLSTESWKHVERLCRKRHIVRLAKITENAILRRMAACIVSFVDLDGIRHSVEVEAEGLYEASVLGLCAFRKHELEPGGLTQLEVEVRSSIKHTLTVTKVREWLQRGVRSPKEAVLKERLRTLLSA